MYAFNFRFRSGVLHIIFCTFVPEIWPSIYTRIPFLLNILRTNVQNFTKFFICIDIGKIYVRIVSCHFCLFVTEFWPLIYVRISFLLNILRPNGQNLNKFCICIYIDNIFVGFVTCYFLLICNITMALY